MLTESMTNELVTALREILGPRISAIVLYGSVARGDQTPDSDVDIALILREPMSGEERERMISRLVDLDWKYDRAFSVNDIEESRFEEWADVLPYYRAIRREGVVLWKAA